jgi:phosphoadenosine phosphosulfate reductase
MGEQVRIIDRIDTAPRYTEADAVRLNNMFRGRDTVEMLTVLLQENMLGDAAIVSSFGAESAVLLHLIASIDPTVPVLFLETGKHFPETITYREELRERIGFTDLRNLTPDPALLAKRDETGLRWSYDSLDSTRNFQDARRSSRRPAKRFPASKSRKAG